MDARYVAFALVLTATPAVAGPLSVAPHLASHMVLQHGKPASFRGGGAKPGEEVTVTFGGTMGRGQANAEGEWQVSLPPLARGESGAVLVRAASGSTLQLDDVVTGDVWLCSGQSNMDLPVSGSANPERTARESAGLPIRLLKLKRTASAVSARDIVPETAWSRAAPDNLGGFSAACWHMARETLKHDPKMPLGLIHAAWGGSTIEDWMSPAALRASGISTEHLGLLERYAGDPTAALAAVVNATDAWAERVDPGSAGAAWAAPRFDDRSWDSIVVPGYWERSGIEGLGGYDGIMWFRTHIALTEAELGDARDITLQLGRIDERDRVWINGVPVGAQLVAGELRRYRIPAGLLRAGGNSIAVRVIDEMGGGGFGGPASQLVLALPGGIRKPLAGDWRYRRGTAEPDWREPPPAVPWSMPRGLAMAWNGMIAPLGGTALRGIAWYQGESNTSRAADYAQSLRAWRATWRTHFGDPSLPVVIVQLPGFGPRSIRPVDAPWARLREAQRLVANDDTNSGLAVTIDLGIPDDIHPAHKNVVGERMAQEALRVAYRRVVPSAPQPVRANRTANGIAITLRSAEGLAVTGAVDPTGFELCDASGSCRFARATVDGDAITVLDDGGPAHEVRYAWQGSPPVNLYARSGLPLTPFRIAIRDR
ncbi:MULTISPECIES: sialate O-acetylesterase [unclassified Sphingomonas]|uniref:sialate O-acetylesterase n=1 Tax=unclassified Sphingomonas TaxID=196159 RepID=UPI002151E3EA|nr:MULTISPECIES: sialate O-acetylesterase [unclassified Sphingomonas]MCR5869460.1 sialate O-acetylesterase [Sphingomonas sp. J344]UUX98810.1 sialate O-acetylesterase [Sphingomonas sp. J315]